ncbi:MAG: hypothetical protein ACHQ49_13070 [Elusimicrobiota bacterium]
MIKTLASSLLLLTALSAAARAQAAVAPTLQELKTMAGPAVLSETPTPVSRPAPLYDKPVLIDQVAPFQKWRALGPKAVGLLIQRGFGGLCQIDHGQIVRQVSPASEQSCASADQNNYTFDADGASPYVAYFKSSGEGFNLMKGWTMPNGYTSDAAMFSNSTPNKWGLKDDAHLAEIAVNGETGSEAGNIHFIISDVKAQSLDASKLVHEALDPYADAGNPAVKALDAKLEDEVAAVEKNHPRYQELSQLPRSRVSFAGYKATWIPDLNELRVVYYRRFEDRYTRETTVGGICPPPPLCRPGHRCPKPPQCRPPHRVSTVYTYGAESAAGESFTADGASVALDYGVTKYFASPWHPNPQPKLP